MEIKGEEKNRKRLRIERKGNNRRKINGNDDK